MKNVTILGGGTAGWLSAYYIKKNNPNYSVKLIESTNIGILGAGEGGTPNLRSLIIDDFGFDENDFLEKVNGTKKYGIIFNKWNKDLSHSFVHGFGFDGLENNLYSYHFNARLFAEYLKNKSQEIGVIHIDDEVSEFVQEKRQITELILKKGRSVSTDFLIDCSGFSRLVIGKLYNTKWNSYEEELLINSAIPFFINETNESINQKTIAEAAEYGWIWKIPLQNRWGCGYLYNSEFVDEDLIKSEIIKLYGDQDVTINKKISFSPGSYENVWVENCIAIGLSTGFLEPLEATSIMTIIYQLRQLPENIFDYKVRSDYNWNVKNYNYQNMTFIRHHYNCSRKDSRFWKTYSNKKIPDVLENIYKTFNNDQDILEIFKIKNGILTFTKDQYKHILNNNFIKNEKTLI